MYGLSRVYMPARAVASKFPRVNRAYAAGTAGQAQCARTKCRGRVAAFRDRPEARVIARPLGYHVAYTQQGVPAVHDRAGSQRHLEVIEELERHSSPTIEIGSTVPRLIG